LFAGEKPFTLSRDWALANKEYRKFHNMDPIFSKK